MCNWPSTFPTSTRPSSSIPACSPLAKVRPGYANFAIAEPPLKLVLVENDRSSGALNHLGVEVDNTAEVTAARKRLDGDGLVTRVEEQVTCCHAIQDKVWVDDPAGAPWEIYTVLSDAPEVDPASNEDPDTGVCCSSGSTASSSSSCNP